MAITMAIPKCSRLICAIVMLASLILLAGTQQTCQGGILWFAQTFPCSLLSAVGAPATPRHAEGPGVLPLVAEDPATAAFAICLVIKDQAEDLREVRSPRPLKRP
jgi:predicted cobalt transporter CbtA